MAYHLYGLVLVIFVALGQLPDVETKKVVCCLPKAFEISEYFLQQTVNNCKGYSIEGQCRYSVNVTAQTANQNCTVIVNGTYYKYRILTLASKHVVYVVNGYTGKCYKLKTNVTLTDFCIYSDYGRKFPNFYLGAKPGELNVSAYHYDFFVSKLFLSYVPYSCVPVEATTYNRPYIFKDSYVDVGLYANYTAGVTCPSCVFNVPEPCRNVTEPAELDGDGDTLFYQKFRFNERKLPYQWKY